MISVFVFSKKVRRVIVFVGKVMKTSNDVFGMEILD